MTIRLLLPLVVPVALRAQAALEYALTTAAGNTAAAGSSLDIAGCRVNSDFVSCLYGAYPRITTIVAVVLTIIVLRWLTGRAGYNRR